MNPSRPPAHLKLWSVFSASFSVDPKLSLKATSSLVTAPAAAPAGPPTTAPTTETGTLNSTPMFQLSSESLLVCTWSLEEVHCTPAAAKVQDGMCDRNQSEERRSPHCNGGW